MLDLGDCFGVADYGRLLHAGQANRTRLKTASELQRADLAGAGLLRDALYAVWRAAATGEVLAPINTACCANGKGNQTGLNAIRSYSTPTWPVPFYAPARSKTTMPDLAAPLRRALERTGYLTGAEPAAATVRLAGNGGGDGGLARAPSFAPEAWWRSNPEATARHGGADLKVYFKFVAEPDAASVAAWQQEVWNQGFCPLLWLVSPQRIDLYNGFGRPGPPADAARNRLATFRLVDEELARLDRLAGRLAMETGQFWRQRPEVNRASAVDGQLLRDLAALKGDLEAAGLAAASAQALIGRSIFTQYLIDRRIVRPERLSQIAGHGEFPGVLEDRAATARLFDWLRDTFNGDMFPSGTPVPAARHLGRVRDFLTATEPDSGQRSLFPYRFDVIPVELISAIYERRGGGVLRARPVRRAVGAWTSCGAPWTSPMSAPASA